MPKQPLHIITSEQFDLIYKALQDADYQLLVETAIESGLRWGELTKPGQGPGSVQHPDGEPRSRTSQPEAHPKGGRFHVKDTRKTASTAGSSSASRSSTSSAPISRPRSLARTTPVRMHEADQRKPRLRVVPEPEAGLTEPNTDGRSYKHGTLSAYTAGPCRCDPCRAAMATTGPDAGQREGQPRNRAPGKPTVTSPATGSAAVWTPAC